MSIYRIYAIILRYAIVGFRELNRLMKVAYFPLLDIAIWGYMGLWIQQSSSNPHILMTYLTAMVLWSTVWAVEIEFSLNLLQEFEARNFVNLASTPLKHAEWLIGNTILGSLKSFIVICASSTTAFLLFGINILDLGSSVIPMIFSMFLSGLILGILLTGLLLWEGQQISVLIWSIPYLTLTLSAPFYPVKMLPHWLQIVVKAFPTTHIFEALRYFINTGTFPQKIILISLGLNSIYLIIVTNFNYRMFNRSKKRGLTHLEQE